MRGLSITKKFLYIALIGVAITGILSFVIGPYVSILLTNCVLIGLLVSDYLASHKNIAIEVKRIGDIKLSINEKEPIRFEVYNKGKFDAQIALIDEVPAFHFDVERPMMSLNLVRGGSEEISYEVIPRKRGAFKFGDLHVKVQGKYGLHVEYLKLPMAQEYKVYPNLQALKKYRLGVFKNVLEKQERKALKHHKQGTSFESLREYVVGDEYRKINWAASARSDKLIVNQYEPEKNQRIYAFIDTGRPMSYTLKGQCKLDKAISTALILSDIVIRSGDLAGVMSFNEKLLDTVMPGKGSRQRDKIMESIYHLESSTATSNYEDAFMYFRGKERRSSIIFFFTDFDTYEEADIIAKAAGVIGSQHLLVVVLMKQLEIEEMAKKNAESEEEIYQKAVALDILQERKKAIMRLNRRNVMCIEADPEKLEWSVINKYIEVKGR